MTEEKLDPGKVKRAKGRIVGLVLAAIAIFAGGVWLLRQPIAEMIARGVCAREQLSCNLSVTRLDFGGATLTDVDARAPGAANAAASAREIVIALVWDGPFSPRAVAVSGSDVMVRADLTGKRSVFGDLAHAVETYSHPSDPQRPLPKLQFANLTVIADTLSGPVMAKGAITASGPDAFMLELAADPSSLGVPSATMDLSAAHLKAKVQGRDIDASATIDLARFIARGVDVADVKLNATLQQSAGVLTGEGVASVGHISARNTGIDGAQAVAKVEVTAPGGEATLANWLANVRLLKIDATAGAGAFGGAEWTKARAAVLIAPLGGGKSSGDLSLVAENLRTPRFVAGQFGVTGKAEIEAGRVGRADGVVTIRGGLIPDQQRHSIANAIAGPLAAALPVYADAIGRAIDQAGQGFTADAPWSVRTVGDDLSLALLDGAALKARSGLSLTAKAAEGHAEAVRLISGDAVRWSGAGALLLQGGGAPSVKLEVDSADGETDRFTMAGALRLDTWKIGTDAISVAVNDIALSAEGGAGKAGGVLTLGVDGGLSGGRWRGVRASTRLAAQWTPDSFSAEAPGGAVVQWERAVYGDTAFGAGALRYTPEGFLARSAGGGIAGKGRLASASIPVDGGGFGGSIDIGETAVSWTMAGGFRAIFDMAPAGIGLRIKERDVAIRIGELSGQAELGRAWKVAGRIAKVTADADEAQVQDAGASFELSGVGDNVNGAISGLAMRVHDPLAENRRYEDMNFRGDATLADGVATFAGTATLAKSGMQMAHVTGRHDLGKNAGQLTFDPTPLIFRPRQFQPSDISPFLVGPANVTGRADIGGAVRWDDSGLAASGSLSLRKLGFALASAGVFEGVSGDIEIADLLNMKSAPGQRIAIDKVTLGLPIENGAIDFQLIGFDAVRVQGAEWPFGGGFIRVSPTDFRFASEAQNRIVARAVDWDLAKLADQFNLPDMKLSGVVGGEFPVVFTTGSAEIDNATLSSVKPGVIRYSGSTGDAAAQADANSKMLFDALKDFRYEVLKVGLDGNLTGRMLLTMSILGRNPDVLSGQPFQLNIGVDSALASLLTSATQKPSVRAAIEQAQDREKEDRK